MNKFKPVEKAADLVGKTIAAQGEWVESIVLVFTDKTYAIFKGYWNYDMADVHLMAPGQARQIMFSTVSVQLGLQSEEDKAHACEVKNSVQAEEQRRSELKQLASLKAKYEGAGMSVAEVRKTLGIEED